LIPTGVVSPVDYKDIGYSSESDLLNSFLSGSVGAYQYNGLVYGIPEELSNYVAWVMPGDFKAAGLAVPTTWSQVCADGPKMLKMSGSKVVQEEVALPTNLAPGQAIMFDTVSREFGSPDFNLAGTKSYLSSAPVIAAATMLQNLVYKCHASVPSLNSSTQGAERYVYWNGNAAMLLTAGTWEAGAVATYPKVKSEVAYPYPKSPSGVTADDLYGYAYVVAKHATDQSLSWELAAALASPGASWLKEEGLFTGAKTVANSATAKAIPEWSSLWEPLYSKGVYIENLNNSTQIDDIIGSAIDSIILSDANVKSTLQSANAQIVPLLNK
jgi:multiple sugar transport system substrate-binding protein